MAEKQLDIFFTFDYELYFGENSGTQQKCIIEPTEHLLAISKKHNVRFSFFVDAGYLVRLNEERKKYSALEEDYKNLTRQVEQLSSAGNDIQLHIHPHWEDSVFDGEKWINNVVRYKHSDFDESTSTDIFNRYTAELNKHLITPVHTYRAGGWCIQPFNRIKDSLIRNGIKIDSTVFKNGHSQSEHYNYDFRHAPSKSSWRFEDDPLIETQNGTFTEISIASVRVSPLHFWKLFLLGRMNPHFHKPIGDGRAMMEKGFRKKILTQQTLQNVTVDGYNASLLKKNMKEFAARNEGREMVIMGHPKALSRFSLQQIERFISDNKRNHNFINYTDYKIHHRL
jgi:hypothetical protein